MGVDLSAGRHPSGSPFRTSVPQRIGPYEPRGILGESAASIVFEAVHGETGDVVALKALRVCNPVELASLRREIELLRSLRMNGIVTIRAHGTHEGTPWYAMDLLRGPDLRSVWAADTTSDLRRVVTVMAALARTLVHLHGKGFVHRDLKPDNIVLVDSDRPVLVDFGFAARLNAVSAREALEVGGALLGTLPYMAPEQIGLDYVDARADLYSFGCILYEAITGAPPFTGPPWKVLERHLRETPEPPRRRRPDCPESLERLVLQLLAKDPRDRIGYAVDVVNALEPGGASANEGPPASDALYLYRAEFTGRRSQIERLDRVLADLARNRGSLLLIEGESGVGKTRLAMEFTRRAAHVSRAVVAGQCAAFGATDLDGGIQSGPLHPLLPLLRYIADYCLQQGADASQRIVGRRSGVLADYEPRFAALPGLEGNPAPAPLPPSAARERLIGDLAETLSRFAREVPTVLLLDDLQWADELTLHFLASLPASFFEENPLCVAACARSEEIRKEIRLLREAPHCEFLELARLPAESVRSIARDMLAVRVIPERLASFLAAQSEGNPFYVAEYLRMAVDESLISYSAGQGWQVSRRDGDGDDRYDRLPLPRSIRELVTLRFRDIDDHSRRLLHAASVLGREFDSSLCAEVAQMSESEQLATTNELLRRQVLEIGVDGSLRFVHDKIREVVYEGIDTGDVRTLHHRAALAIEERCRARSDFSGSLARLAVHFHRAAALEQAARYYSLAAESALKIGAAGDAQQAIRTALQCDSACEPRANSLTRARWLRVAGEAAQGVGDFSGVIAETSAALDELGEPQPSSEYAWLGRMAIDLTKTLRGPRPASPDDAERTLEAAACSGLVTHAYYLRSEVLSGLGNSIRCVVRSESAGRPGLAAQCISQAGYLAGTVGFHRVAERAFRKAKGLRHEADPNVFGGSMYFESLYRTGQGSWEEATALAAESLAMLSALGNRQEAEIAGAIVANALYYQGAFERSLEYCERVLESASARGNIHHTAWGWFLGGRALLGLGQLDEATRRLELGSEMLAPLDDVLSRIMCSGSLARAYLYSGRIADAERTAKSLEQDIETQVALFLVQCIDGVAALPEVTLACDALPSAAARRACTALSQFACMFPIARPAAARNWAVHLRDSGHVRAARRCCRYAIRRARALRMPYEEARSHQAMLALVTGDSERAQHLDTARRLFESTGSRFHLEELSRAAA